MMINKIGYIDADKLQKDYILNLDLIVSLSVDEYINLINVLNNKGMINLK